MKMCNSVKYIVDNKARQYEHNIEELDRAREQAENESNNYGELAPGTEQTEQESIEEGVIQSEQYVHFNPDRPAEHRFYDMAPDLGVSATTVELSSHATRLKDDEYLKLMRCLKKNNEKSFSMY